MLGSHGAEYARSHYERVSNKGDTAAVEIRHHTTTVQGVCALALLCVCKCGARVCVWCLDRAPHAYQQQVPVVCIPYCYPNH